MSNTITGWTEPAYVTEPELLLGYESTRRSLTRVHDLVGGGVAVTRAPAQLRSGSLDLFYMTEADAAEAFDVLGHGEVYLLTSTELAHIDMAFVVDGSIRIQLDEGRKRWVVTVGYQETQI